MEAIKLQVNGRKRTVHCATNATLVDVIREQLHLTGTHVGCDTSQCGACTVHLDGDAVKACTILAAQCDGSTLTTIEGLAQNEVHHPMQQAFNECHGLQCGFCTPGMIMSAVDLVHKEEELSPEAIRSALEGNICRCTGYQNIVAAVVQGAAGMKEQQS
ncbi:MAG: (2Fe-2S)-binding protein [Pseudomonadales bacterium]